MNFGNSRIGRDVYMGTRDIKKADIVLFTGGADVDPQIYGERALSSTHIDPERDRMDMDAWLAAEDKVKVGICRGGQFLNVMCGGSLWQDVDCHRAPHVIYERMTGARIQATSTHHQMMRPGPNCRIIATAMEAKNKRGFGMDNAWTRRTPNFNPNVVKFDDDRMDLEVCAYDKAKVLCFQPHPELPTARNQLKNFFFNQLDVTFRKAAA